jgi:predicted amidohydrolase
MEIKLCHKSSNARRAMDMALEAMGCGAEIIALPELFLTGFCYDLPPENLSRPYLNPFLELSEEQSCLILGSVMAISQDPDTAMDGYHNSGPGMAENQSPESRVGRWYNLGFCIEGGRVQFRPKIHPFVPERHHFKSGDFIASIETSLGMIGLQVCYDLRFPEVGRSLALQDADLLATVAQFPASRLSQWRILCQARAIENQLHHIACNWAQGGGSMILGPQGDIISEANPGEAIIYGEIDLQASDRFRLEIPCFEDRRPEVYRL